MEGVNDVQGEGKKTCPLSGAAWRKGGICHGSLRLGSLGGGIRIPAASKSKCGSLAVPRMKAKGTRRHLNLMAG